MGEELTAIMTASLHRLSIGGSPQSSGYRDFLPPSQSGRAGLLRNGVVRPLLGPARPGRRSAHRAGLARIGAPQARSHASAPSTTHVNSAQETAVAPLSDAHIWRIVAGEWPRLLRAGLCCVVSVACNLASPVISGRLFQNLVQQQPFDGYALS